MPPDSSPAPAVRYDPTANRLPHQGNIDCDATIDMVALRAYRLNRVREQLRARDYGGIVLYDPLNIRYATGARNMAVWTTHNAVRYCFIATEGPVVLFDFHNSEHLSADLESISETRPAKAYYYFGAGPRYQEIAEKWAEEIADLMRSHGGGNTRLAIDHCGAEGHAALLAAGFDLRNGEEIMELARSIKSAEELACMQASLAVCHTAMAQMREQLEAGMTENELWSILNQVNAAHGGEWIETRLLTSGPRANPWFREASDRIIRPGELVSFDTDMIGPYGYCSDVSRTFFCGPGRPSDEQRRLYGLSWEQINHNIDILKPGMTFRELLERSYQLPESMLRNRYSVVIHGVGLADEYPSCYYAEDWEASGYDGVFHPNMTVSVESYVGEDNGSIGVKLEQMVLFTETGVELLSTFPLGDELLPSRWI